MATYSIDITEDQGGGKLKRVMRHTFYGATPAEAKHYAQSHKKADHFFKAATSGRSYKGIPLMARKVKKTKKSRKSSRHY